jgi:hypothetical protein
MVEIKCVKCSKKLEKTRTDTLKGMGIKGKVYVNYFECVNEDCENFGVEVSP